MEPPTKQTLLSMIINSYVLRAVLVKAHMKWHWLQALVARHKGLLEVAVASLSMYLIMRRQDLQPAILVKLLTGHSPTSRALKEEKRRKKKKDKRKDQMMTEGIQSVETPSPIAATAHAEGLLTKAA